VALISVEFHFASSSARLSCLKSKLVIYDRRARCGGKHTGGVHGVTGI